MKYLLNVEEYSLNEELKKYPTEYKYTKNKKADEEHNRLASKDDEGHHWKKSKKKGEKDEWSQLFTCQCGYKKEIKQGKDKSVLVIYSK